MFARVFIVLICVLILATTLTLADQTPQDLAILPLDHPSIRYSGPLTTRSRGWMPRIVSGKAKLDYRAGLGYLPSPACDSRSEPGFAIAGIFKDQLSSGQDFTEQSARAVLQRRSDVARSGAVTYWNWRRSTLSKGWCLHPRCSEVGSAALRAPRLLPAVPQGPATLGIPGLLVGSVFPDASGMPNSRMGNPVTDDNTPIQKRWGGWYVTGNHRRHESPGKRGGPRSSCAGFIGVAGNAESDKPRRQVRFYGLSGTDQRHRGVMTLEHQTRMVNLMIRTGWDQRMNATPGRYRCRCRSAGPLHAVCRRSHFVRSDRGVSTFTKTFAERGPRDHQGRSLRDFDLHKRMFRYP